MDIRLHFDGFWNGFTPNDNVFVWVLGQKHNVIIDNINPNLVFTLDRKKFPNAFTVYYNGGEPYYPEPSNDIADYFIGSFYLDYPNYTRFPHYYLYLHFFIKNGIIPSLDFFKMTDRTYNQKTKFCSMVSRSMHGKRGRFFEKLNKYKKVETNASPYHDFSIPFDGTSLNSTLPKINHLKDYKFNIAFENNYRAHYSSYPNAIIENGELNNMNGLINEKLVEPFVAGVIPIYWGSDRVHEEFNSNTFLNYFDFNSEDELIEKIIELDNNDNLYNSYFKEPISGPNDILTLDYLVDMFEEIIKKI
jgi:hypothetical protein